MNFDLELSVLDANLPDDIPGHRSDLSPEDREGVEVKTARIIVLKRQASFII